MALSVGPNLAGKSERESTPACRLAYCGHNALDHGVADPDESKGKISNAEHRTSNCGGRKAGAPTCPASQRGEGGTPKPAQERLGRQPGERSAGWETGSFYVACCI